MDVSTDVWRMHMFLQEKINEKVFTNLCGTSWQIEYRHTQVYFHSENKEAYDKSQEDIIHDLDLIFCNQKCYP